MTEGLVSIITTLYNSGDFIAKTIESVMSQTYTNWEMVITDDCSDDDGPAIVESYAANEIAVIYESLSFCAEQIVYIPGANTAEPDSLKYVVPFAETKENAVYD